MGGACRTYGERGSVYRLLVGKPKGKSPLGIPTRGSTGNIKMGLFMKRDWGGA
jgi:hypothetical protein